MFQITEYAKVGNKDGLVEWLRTHPHPHGIDRQKNVHGVGSALFRACMGLWCWRDVDEETRSMAVRTLLECGADPNQLSPPGWGVNVIVNNVANFGYAGIFWILVDAGALTSRQCFPWTTGPLPVGSALFHAVSTCFNNNNSLVAQLVEKYGMAHFIEDYEDACYTAGSKDLKTMMDAVPEDKRDGMIINSVLRTIRRSQDVRSELKTAINSTPGLLNMKTMHGRSLLDCVFFTTPDLLKLFIEIAKVDASTLGKLLENASGNSSVPNVQTLRHVSKATLCHVFEAGGRFDFDDTRLACAIDAWREYVDASDMVDVVAGSLPVVLPIDLSRNIAQMSLGVPPTRM